MPPQIDELLKKCESALQAKNYEDAITGCRAVLSLSPENSRAKEILDEAQSKLEAELFVRENLRKAEESFKKRDFQKCINECNKIQLLDPDNPAVTELINRAQEKLEAEPFIQNFITSGQSLFDSGLYGEAASQWEKVKAIDPMYPDLDALISNAHEKMSGGSSTSSSNGMFDLGGGSAPELDLSMGMEEPAPFGLSHPSAEAAEPGFESDEDKVSRLLKEGDELAAAGQHQRAIDTWSEIFMIDVSNSDALQRIEASRNALSQAKAEPEAEEASLQDLLTKGSEAEAAGQYREAAQFFSQALAIDAENAELADKIKNLNLLAKKQDRGKTVLGNARAFMEEGKFESARHALSKILEADPENEEALEMMRELKARPSTAQAEARPAAAAAKPKAGFPLVPALAIGAVIVIGGGVAAFFSMRSPKGTGGEPEQPQVVKKTVEPAAQPAKPVVKSTPAPVNVSPEMKAAAAKSVEEAAFYLQEKHYPEAVQKADAALAQDPSNEQAKSIKDEANKRIQEAQAAEKKVLDDANTYFSYSEFAGAVKLYEKYLEGHPEAVNEVQPQIIKCYYNLGVIMMRQWKCDTGADYFRQVLFIDENDRLSKDALALARKCQQVGTSDLEIKKQVTFLEMRK